MAKNVLICILITLFSLGSVMALFHSGLIPTHDGEYHVVRFYEFDKVLRSGVIYPRIAPDLNNGYSVPLFNFVYPLPNYIASFFHAFGFSFIDAFKANLILASVLGSLGMYLWSKLFWGRFGGFISSVVYAFAPYRLLDIYVRGSVGEIWALAIFPYVLFSITKLILYKDKRFIALSAVFIALLIFSHNILALLFFVFLLTYIFILYFQNKDTTVLILTFVSVVLGVGVSAIFWLPAILEKQFVRGLEIFSVDRHFVEIYQLLIPSWGSGFSGVTSGSELSFQIGVVNLLVLILVFVFLFKNKKKSRLLIISIFCILWVLVAIFCMLAYSKILWSTIPFMNFFQFPWRLLSIVILLLAFLSGVVAQFRQRYILGGVMLVASVALTYSYTKPAYYHERSDEYYILRPNFIHGTNSPGNVFNTFWFVHENSSPEAKFITDNSIKMDNVYVQPETYRFDYVASASGKIMVHTAYFPGWKANVNGIDVDLIRTRSGLMELTVPEGSARVVIVFADTIVRQIANAASLISLFVVFLLFYKFYHYEDRN